VQFGRQSGPKFRQLEVARKPVSGRWTKVTFEHESDEAANQALPLSQHHFRRFLSLMRAADVRLLGDMLAFGSYLTWVSALWADFLDS
jgi:hypothetical protein